jgi:hypothetical protein
MDLLAWKLNRLIEHLGQFAPIESVIHVTGTTVEIVFKPEATSQQQTNALAALAAFDWSDAADGVWLENQKPNRKTLREQKDAAITRLNQIITFNNPTNAQVVAAVKDVALYVKHLINRTVEID